MVLRADPIIKHVFEVCRIRGRLPGSRRRNLSVGRSIVWQQFDHMFYKSNK